MNKIWGDYTGVTPRHIRHGNAHYEFEETSDVTMFASHQPMGEQLEVIKVNPIPF